MKSRIQTLLVMGIAVLTLAALFLPALDRALKARPMCCACTDNLMQLGIVFQRYRGEEPRHAFPPAIEVNGTWSLDLRSVYGEFLSDWSILICPDIEYNQRPTNAFSMIPYILRRTLWKNSEKTPRETLRHVFEQNPPDWDTAHRIAAQNYCYLGWAIHDAADITLFLSAPNKKPGEDLTIDGHTLYWLRDGVEQHFLKDVHDPAESARVQNSIPVAFDNPATHAHKPNGVNVLFLDGHVQFVKLSKDASYRQVLETIIQAGR